MGVIDIDICILNHLKEDLAWAVGKWLQVISTKILFESSKSKLILQYLKTRCCNIPSLIIKYKYSNTLLNILVYKSRKVTVENSSK